MKPYECPNGHKFPSVVAVDCEDCEAQVACVPMAALMRQTDKLRGAVEVIADLLPAWLNGWEPGANQDIIDRAEAVLGPLTAGGQSD